MLRCWGQLLFVGWFFFRREKAKRYANFLLRTHWKPSHTNATQFIRPPGETEPEYWFILSLSHHFHPSSLLRQPTAECGRCGQSENRSSAGLKLTRINLMFRHRGKPCSLWGFGVQIRCSFFNTFAYPPTDSFRTPVQWTDRQRHRFERRWDLFKWHFRCPVYGAANMVYCFVSILGVFLCVLLSVVCFVLPANHAP